MLQGDRGYSQKGPEPGNASYYYSLTRMPTTGSVTVDGKTYTVSGQSWMDHEYSTSALGPEQTGWDWFSIQLDNNTELMVFQLRRADGSVDAFSSGTFVAADGSTTRLGPDDFKIDPTGRWRSPRTGGEYPSGWRVTVPRLDLSLDVQPLIADQEMQVSYVYWEGAVGVTGSAGGQPVTRQRLRGADRLRGVDARAVLNQSHHGDFCGSAPNRTNSANFSPHRLSHFDKFA